jgi:hypothetical protein
MKNSKSKLTKRETELFKEAQEAAKIGKIGPNFKEHSIVLTEEEKKRFRDAEEEIKSGKKSDKFRDYVVSKRQRIDIAEIGTILDKLI